MDWLSSPVVWLVAAILLFIADVLGAAGFLIGAGVAAIAMAALTFFFPDLGIGFQVAVYAVLAVVSTLVYFKFFRATQPSNNETLPKRAEMMLGRRFTLGEKLAAGTEIRVQLGDAMWVVTSPHDIDLGAEVEVVDCDAMRLQIAAVS